MKAYYAHCKAIYKTPQESRDMDLIRSLGMEPVNPSDPKWDDGWAKYGMELKEVFAEDCDLIVFRALPGGEIPAGVAKEIEAFQKKFKPVLELPSLYNRKQLNVEETRAYLHECGQR